MKAYYNYAINGFTENLNNADIIDIEYGNGKFPIHIFKKDTDRLINAILSPNERRQRLIARIEEDDIEYLNRLLKGRAMILITDFENYSEYCSSGQNGIEEITGMDISGKLNSQESFDYKTLAPGIEDLYPNYFHTK